MNNRPIFAALQSPVLSLVLTLVLILVLSGCDVLAQPIVQVDAGQVAPGNAKLPTATPLPGQEWTIAL